MGTGMPPAAQATSRDDRGGRAEQAPMRSPVNWGVLGLLIERPTYAYDLAHRFERRYAGVLALSNIGHVYTALGALEGRGLIAEIPGTRGGRQPKPRYRATDAGVDAYRSWLLEQAGEEARCRRLYLLALGAFSEDPQAVLDVIADCEQGWLAQGMASTIPDGEASDGVLASLIAEQERLAVGAKLEWVQYARRWLAQLLSTGRRA